MKGGAGGEASAPLVVRPVRPQNTNATVGSTLAVAMPVAEAALPIPEQCAFMVRGRRRCRRRAGGCGLGQPTHCLDHQSATLEAARQAAVENGAAHAAAAAAAAKDGASAGVPKKKSRKRRVSSSQKRMLNPFSFRELPAEVIEKVVSQYKNPCLPLVVDIGAAQGRFLGKLQPVARADLNYLGLELRGWCVDAANEQAASAGVDTRLQYLEGSANNITGPLLDQLGNVALECSSCPPWAARPRQLLLACVQFPDPWSKGKTRRRRIIQPDLANILAADVKTGGFVYASTDCAELALEMKTTLLGTKDWNNEPCFRLGGLADVAALSAMLQLKDGGNAEAAVMTASPWLPSNPFGIPSEREIVCEEFGRQVLRALYVRMPRPSKMGQGKIDAI
eukprot:gene16988-33920_t